MDRESSSDIPRDGPHGDPHDGPYDDPHGEPDQVRPPDRTDLERCPMPCAHCQGSGDCEDCLDCLLWPHVDDDEPFPPPQARGYAIPLQTQELEVARAALTLATRVGLVMRRCRRERLLSQRALARELGWSPSAVGRAEVDATALTLAALEHVLAFTGHRLAIVPATDEPVASLGEDPDHVWGLPEVVARNAAGRRLPPYGRALFRTESERIQEEGLLGHREPWVWQQPVVSADGP